MAAVNLTRRLDQLLAPLVATDSPGFSVGIAHRGRVVYKAGFGLADLEHQVPVAADTVFHVASVSKQFTAFMVALLAKERKLSLDDDIRQHVPEVPDLGHKITLRHLVHHTSGLRDQWELLLLAGWRIEDVITTADILQAVRGQRRLNFRPGASHLYSNTGYTLLAVAAERVTRMSFRDLCAERIFGPLAMLDTHFHDDHGEVDLRRADSYVPKPGGGYRRAVLSYSNVGATSLFTTTGDLLRWLANLESGKVGGKALVARVQRPGALADGTRIEYAYGLMRSRHRGSVVIQHSGGDAGYRSQVVRVPRERLSVAVLANNGGIDVSTLALAIADVCLDRADPTPAAREPTAGRHDVDAPALAGVFVDKGSGQSMEFADDDGVLVLRVSDQAEMKLIRLGHGNYRIPIHNQARIAFGPATAGEAAKSLKLSLPGVLPRTLVRVKAHSRAKRQSAYVGTYRSEELDTRVRVKRVGDELYFVDRKHGKALLRPITADRFVTSISLASIAGLRVDVRFRFAKDGKATDLATSTGRAWNVRFVRES